MTLEEKRRYLGRYQISAMRIRGLQAEIESLRSFAQRTTQSFDSQPGGGNTPSDRVGLLAAQIADDEQKIREELSACMRLRNEIRNMIQEVGDEKARELLRMRFLCGKKIWQMAASLHYDERFLRRKLNHAVEMVDFSKIRPQKPFKARVK